MALGLGATNDITNFIDRFEAWLRFMEPISPAHDLRKQ